MFSIRNQYVTPDTTHRHDAQEVLRSAALINLRAVFASYSRASFLFPDLQPREYQSFDVEVGLLNFHLGDLARASRAHVLGDRRGGLQWHVYTAGMPAVGGVATGGRDVAAGGLTGGSSTTLEIAMTGLDVDRAAQFVCGGGKGAAEGAAAEVTARSGIGALVPGATIDDFLFEPCGCAPRHAATGTPVATKYEREHVCVVSVHTVLHCDAVHTIR
jgi:S-adenosylmethionine decarboxylase